MEDREIPWWAVALLDQVMNRLAEEMIAGGKRELFEELGVFLTGDNTEGSYARAAARLGMSEGNLRVATHRMRRRYRELLRMQIGMTVSCSEEIDDEIRHLFAALG